MGGSMAVTQGLLDEFGPVRVRNTPISEMAIVGSGIGAAIQGMRPIVEIMYEDFLTISMEQLVNQAAKHRTMSGGQVKVPLTIRTQGGAGWSPGAQHAQQLEAWFVHVPGLKVVFASTPEDVAGSGRRSTTTRRLLRAPDAVRDQGRGARGARADPARQGADPPRGNGRHRHRDRTARPRSARSCRGGREGRDLRRGRRPGRSSRSTRRRSSPPCEDHALRDRA